MIGRNGQGKSTLLKAIAHKIIPGIPENLRILLVDQVEDHVDEGGSSASQLTVTQTVVKSDRRREIAMKEHDLLSAALDSNSLQDASDAVVSVRLGRAQWELGEAKKVALKRSGARGAQARKDLLKAEANVKKLEERLEEVRSGTYDSNVVNEGSELLLDVQSALDAMDAFATEAHAQSILTGLGFTQDQLGATFSTQSGGWRSRCSLASALLQKPDLLILDEPTNWLDLPSVIWLQTYLNSFTTTVLLVAHDREFVDNIAQEVIILRNQSLTYFDGNLTEYEVNTKEKRRALLKQQSAMDRKKEAIEKSIEEGARSARKTGDENRARMVKSRQKKLDDRWGLEVNDKGHKFKLNRDFGVYHFTSRKEIEIEQLDRDISLPFPDPEPMRFPGALISASGIHFRYNTKTPYILEDVPLTVHPGSRVGIVGRNGEGKSTLLKLLIGTLKPARGTIEHHPRLKLGYFDQHSVEVLSDVRESSIEYFMTRLRVDYGIDVDEGTTRGFLGSFGIQGKKALNPITSLSGGQKVRLALALIVYRSPDLLILDEVSTHLDLDTINALILSLRGYAGAVLLVSHDRHLMRCVIEGSPLTPPGEDGGQDPESDEEDVPGGKIGTVYMVGPKGKMRALTGGIDEYVRIVERKMRKQGLL